MNDERPKIMAYVTEHLIDAIEKYLCIEIYEYQINNIPTTWTDYQRIKPSRAPQSSCNWNTQLFYLFIFAEQNEQRKK